MAVRTREHVAHMGSEAYKHRTKGGTDCSRENTKTRMGPKQPAAQTAQACKSSVGKEACAQETSTNSSPGSSRDSKAKRRRSLSNLNLANWDPAKSSR